MLFKFIGDETGDGPEVSTHFGVEFTKGVFSEVSDSFAVEKLKANRHFVAAESDQETFGFSGMNMDQLSAAADAIGVKIDRRRSVESIREQLTESANANHD